MKILKTLIETNNDSEILAYIKGDFATKIDSYIDIVNKIPKLEEDYLSLQLDGIERQKKIDDMLETSITCCKNLKP